MKKTLITLLALSGLAMGDSAITGLTDFNGKKSGDSITLPNADIVKMTISGNNTQIWLVGTRTQDAWTNTKALTLLNRDLGLQLTADDIVGYSPVGCGPEKSWTDLTYQFNNLTTGDEVVIYTLATGGNSKLANFKISGLQEGAAITYATNNGDGFSTSEIYSESSSTATPQGPTFHLNYTLIRIQGVLDSKEVTLSARKDNKNLWGMIAYTTVPEPTSATLCLLALTGLATRRRRK